MGNNPLLRPLFIIADIGSNWCRTETDSGNLKLALRQIELAAGCGVDAVKFQLFTHAELYGYPGEDRNALKREWLPILADACQASQVEFMCTAFSPEGISVVDPFVNVHKLASSEFPHVLMSDKLIATGKPFIVSTGACIDNEVRELCTRLLAEVKPDQFAILECIAAYPAYSKDYNLTWLAMLGNDGVEHLGISDHTLSNSVSVAAAGVGATIFEKHFDGLGDEFPLTPDSAVSIPPIWMRGYCTSIREAASAVRAFGVKTLLGSEQDMAARHRRRLKITKPVEPGGMLRFGENYGIYRSKTPDFEAAAPSEWALFDGKIANRELKPGEGVWSGVIS